MAVVGRRFKLSRRRYNPRPPHHEDVCALSFQAPDRRRDRVAENHCSKLEPRLRVREPTRRDQAGRIGTSRVSWSSSTAGSSDPGLANGSFVTWCSCGSVVIPRADTVAWDAPSQPADAQLNTSSFVGTIRSRMQSAAVQLSGSTVAAGPT